MPPSSGMIAAPTAGSLEKYSGPSSATNIAAAAATSTADPTKPTHVIVDAISPFLQRSGASPVSGHPENAGSPAQCFFPSAPTTTLSSPPHESTRRPSIVFKYAQPPIPTAPIATAPPANIQV